MVICEGKTEANYLVGLRRRGGPQIHVAVAKRSDARCIVQEAAESSDSGYSEVWAVFDTECRDISAVSRDAAVKDVALAVSHPCFEVWLLLHHKDHRAPFQSSQDAADLLRRVTPRWAKGDGTRFTEFADGVDAACARAKKLDPSGKAHHLNPSTNVWMLVERLDVARGPGERT